MDYACASCPTSNRMLGKGRPKTRSTPCPTSDVLSPRILRIIEDLAGDWRRLDERVEGLSERDRSHCAPGYWMRTSDERARRWADHLQRDGGRDRRRGCVHEGPDFAAWLGLVPKQISTGDRTILGKISRRGNRYLRVLFVQAAWVVLIKPKRAGSATGSNPGSRQPGSDCITTCWRSPSPTSSPASPGVFLRMDARSKLQNEAIT